MAANVIIKILSKLVKKHGLAKGVKKAQKLGFSNKDIKAAVSRAGVRRKKDKFPHERMTFKERKTERVGWAKQAREDERYIPSPPHRQLGEGPNMKEWRAMWRKDPNDPRNWQTGQTGPAHEIYGIPGIDF